MEKITFQTPDGVTITGDYAAGGDGRAALLLHMMPATRESWQPLAEKLQAAGFATLAIDLRGHGESRKGPGDERLDYKKFTDSQHQQKMVDVESAIRWLMEQGNVPGRIAIAGASIGANLSIAYAGAHQEIPAVAALSPGLNYRGVLTEESAKLMPRAQKLLLVASAEDRDTYDSVQRLADVKEGAEVQLLNGAGHGTAIFDNVPGFLDYVAAWIASNVK